jgi:hypothetical protein
MCARDNSLVVALNSSISGDNTASYNINEFTWRVNFEYGTILGESTCLSAAEGGDGTGGSGSIINSNGDMIPQSVPKGRSGQSDPNPDNPDLDRNRVYCWCRMTHPAMSRWVFREHRGTMCAHTCAEYCSVASGVNNVSNLRKAMFNSIGK